MNGFINLNKPGGITSRKVLNQVMTELRIKKAGHAGTLDPFATGVLPICIGRATKLSEYISAGQKSYRAILFLGLRTDTLDITGNTLERNDVHPDASDADVRSLLASYIGNFKQKIPDFSAKKINGVPLYRMARQGAPIPELYNEIQIFRICLTRYEYPEIEFEIDCSKGTYIRAIGSHIGDKLGTGAALKALMRLKVGPFEINSAVMLQDLAHQSNPGNWLLPLDFGVNFFNKAYLNVNADKLYRNGGLIDLQELEFLDPGETKDGIVAVYSHDKRFIGLGEIKNPQEDGKSFLKSVRLIDIQK